jgi:peroxiredoxin
VKLAQLAQLVFVLLAAVAVYGFITTARDGERRRVCTPLCALGPNYAGDNRVVPDFTLASVSGKQIKFTDYRGKVVILNFWTKTCAPCLEEMPSLADLARSIHGRKDLAVVTISTDETADDVRATLQSVLSGQQAPFEVLLDPGGETVTGKFGTKLFPETWFIDNDGIIRARIDGARDWSNALAIDFAESLIHPPGCPIRFLRGRAGGDFAALCEEMTGS